ncbi:MAG: protein-glutamate O-methyltransferase [Gemmatimonas sp.]
MSECELTPAQFARITGWLYEHSGIRLREGKEGLVRARLAKRLRHLGLTDFTTYLARIESEPDRREFAEMIDALTTNKTSFLRERAHFDFLQREAFPKWSGPIRLWSAGCASGEEAYTLGMLALESSASQALRDVRVLATDISHRVLSTAAAGVYSAESMADVPAEWLERYWTRQAAGTHDTFEAGATLRQLVHFARLNLMEKWPMHGPFDAIFCRNVMIYFDKGTQQRLVERFHALLKPGGYLFVGHSESLTGLTHRFRYVQPAVYVK